MKRIVTALAAVLLVAACSATTTTNITPTVYGPAATARATQAPPSAEAPAAKTPAPTQFVPTPAPPAAGTPVIAIGETAHMTCQGVPCGEITVSNVSQATKFTKTGWTEKPDAGYVFLSAKVTYKNIGDKSVDYNPFDWVVSTDGDASDPPCATGVSCFGSIPIVIAGPSPTLHSGTLSAGKSVSGYIVWEVPATGEVRIGYQGYNSTSLFEVILRAS